LLFECGGIQEGKTTLDNYKLNKQLLSNIKPQNVEFVFVGHNHYDHISNIVSLFATKKCNARIIVPKGSTPILREMWLDSAFINKKDCEYLSSKLEKQLLPLYTENDVEFVLQRVEEYEFNQIIELDNQISFKFIPAGHILCSCQMELFIKQNSRVKKIAFTSDIGNTLTEDSHVFIEKFQPITKSNILIGECTYSKRGRGMSKKDFNLDINKIKSVIEQYCVDRDNRVLIPTFSLCRMPYIMWLIYTIWGHDKNFHTPVYIDSPLSIRLLDCYSKILQGKAKEQYDDMMSWNNFRFISDANESKLAVADKKAKVILSSSGMMQAGRSVKWVQDILPKENDCILFIGYASENTLAYKIKNGKTQKTISINGKVVKNKCQIVDLHSFSSHMQREQLINYYKNCNCDTIYLVHSNKKDRLEFKEDLEKAIEECYKTTRVVAVNKSTKITL